MNRIGHAAIRTAGLLLVSCFATAGCAPGGRGFDASVAGAGAEVRLAPDPAFAAARIGVVFAEPEPDPALLRIEWRRNGSTIAGETSASLDPSRFAKGDRVSVHVFVAASEGRAARELTASVEVANSPPRVVSVGISQEASASGAELRAGVEYLDPDREEPRLEYAWFANGREIEGVRDAVLPAAKFARGDRITLTVVARDGESESPPVTSEPFVLENRPPSFTSRPALPRAGEGAFEYQAVAHDPDGDPLRFTLDGAPPGMTVDAFGRVRWDLPAGSARHGEHAVRLRVADPHGGEAVQEFTIRL